MRPEKNGPTQLPLDRPERRSLTHSNIHQNLIRCKWHDRPIVDGLPGRCPAREAKPYAAIQRLKDSGWARLDPSGPRHDSIGGQALLDKVETCTRCIGSSMRHPIFKRLREAAMREAEPRTGRPPIPDRPARPARAGVRCIVDEGVNHE